MGHLGGQGQDGPVCMLCGSRTRPLVAWKEAVSLIGKVLSKFVIDYT